MANENNVRRRTAGEALRRNSSACNCALAAQLAANELEQPGICPFAAGNSKMGGFRNSEAGRLNCYVAAGSDGRRSDEI